MILFIRRMAIVVVIVLGGLVFGFPALRNFSVNAQPESPLPLPSPAPSRFEPFPDGEMLALKLVSERFGLSLNELHVGGQVIIKYPTTNKTVWQATVASNDGKQSEIVTIDVGTRDILDGDAVQESEDVAISEQYGKISSDLYQRLQELNDDDVVTATVWYAIDAESFRTELIAKHPELQLMGIQPGLKTDLEAYDKFFAELIEAERKNYEARSNEVSRNLELQGIQVEYAVSLAPILSIRCTKAKIIELSKSDSITALYLDKNLKNLLDSTASTDRVPVVWTRGKTGAGVKVAVIEYDGIYFGHTYLQDGTYYNSASPNIGDHATEMAGIIASTHPTYRGIAYGAPALYSANHQNTSYSAAEAATSAAVNANSNVLNFSQGADENGVINDFTRFVDHMAFNYLRTVVAGSGNDPRSDAEVLNPALGYNAIAVGGISDFDTPNWSDDQIWLLSSFFNQGSSWKNPPDGREKPEVVADAGTVTTTDTNNGFSVPCAIFVYCAVGTSGATAQVSGLAALLMDRDPLLKSWPQAVKSVIMASAVHDVDASNTEGGNSIVSDKGGIGAIDAALADSIVQNNWFVIDSIANGTGSAEKIYNVNVTAGERIRVVLSWLSHTSLGSTRTDVLSTNLNLRIEDKDNVFVVDSLSTVDNFEAVEFVAAKSGTYKFKVQRPSSSSVIENFSLAWSKQATYLPDVRLSSGGWNSAVYIRNDDAMPRTAKVTLLNTDGSVNGPRWVFNLQANGVGVLNSGNTGISGWSGSAIVDGSEDLSVVVEHSKATEKMDYTGIGGYIGGWGATGTTLYSPSLKNNYASRTGKIYVVNVGSAATNVAVSLRAADNGSGIITCNPTNLQGMQVGKQATFQASDCATSAGTIYGVSLTASQPLAGIAVEFNSSDGSLTAAANLMRGGATTNYAPIFKYDYGGNRATLVAQNVGSSATTVTATYYHPTSGPWSESYTLNPLSTHVFSPLNAKDAYGVNMLPNTLATAVVTVPTGQKVAITLYENKVGGNWRMQQSGSNVGSKLAILPEVYRGYASGGATWGSAFLVMNTGSSTANITVRYYDAAGNWQSSANQTGTAAPNKAITFNISNNVNLTIPFNGSALVEADQPIIVSGNITTTASSGDPAMSFNAINR